MIPEERNSDRMLTLDCPENRDFIINLLKSRFPNIRIYGWDSHLVHGSERDFYLNKCMANFPVQDI